MENQDQATQGTDTTTRTCDTGNDERYQVCATYVKNTDDVGYTVRLEANVPYDASFSVSEPELRTIEGRKTRYILITANPAGKGGGQSGYTGSKSVDARTVASDQETHIQVDLDAASIDNSLMDRVGRKVILVRQN